LFDNTFLLLQYVIGFRVLIPAISDETLCDVPRRREPRT